MSYLYCKDLFNREKFIEISPDQEKHITKLINEKRIPKHFKLNGHEVNSEEIIGYSDTKPEEPKPELGIHSMEDLRKWAEKQKWYKKKKPSEFQDNASPQSLL